RRRAAGGPRGQRPRARALRAARLRADRLAQAVLPARGRGRLHDAARPAGRGGSVVNDERGPRSRVLVTVDELAADLRLGTGPDPEVGAPVLLDVRWALGMTDGHERYLQG